MGVNGEDLQLHSVYEKISRRSCKNPYQYYKSRENLYQVPQVTHAVSEREHYRRQQTHDIFRYSLVLW